MAQQHRSRGLIGGILAAGGVAVTAVIVGTLALTGVFSSGGTPANATDQQPARQYQYAAPWADRERINPVSTDDAKIRSVARYQQYRQAWSASVAGDIGAIDRSGRSDSAHHDQFRPVYTFDPSLEVGEQDRDRGSLIAGVEVRRAGGARIGQAVVIEEYGDPADATARVEAFRQDQHGEELEMPAIPGADDLQATLVDCDGEGSVLQISTLVEGTVRVTVAEPCVTPWRGEGGVAERLPALTEVTEAAVGVARQVYGSPVPEAWMDRTAELPVLSDGRWDAEQVVVEGREDGLDLDSTLPAPFAGAGVELVIRAKDEIFRFGDERQAAAVMDELLRDPERGDRGRWADFQDRTGDENEVCGESIHWQQGTICWIRTGKYITVTGADGRRDGTSDPIDRTQAELLEGH